MSNFNPKFQGSEAPVRVKEGSRPTYRYSKTADIGVKFKVLGLL